MSRLTWFIIILIIVVVILIINYNKKTYQQSKIYDIINKEQDEKVKKFNGKNKSKQLTLQLITIVPNVLPFKVHEIPFVLSKKQCSLICEEALPKLQPSKLFENLIRSSTSCILENTITTYIQNVASHLSGYPIDHVEIVQIVKYEEGQAFNEHYDTDPNDKTNPAWSRIATFMIYLNDEVIGGETEFPLLKKIVEPSLGKGLFWWNVSGGELIPETLHKGRYVIDGTKWIANTWVHSISMAKLKLLQSFQDMMDVSKM